MADSDIFRPGDLLPLPTQPWEERPDSIPLDIEECRTALWNARGNVSKAAIILRITPSRLRAYVNKSPRLIREQQEWKELLLDKFEENVWDAMESEDHMRRDTMTRYVGSNLAHSRGWGAKAASLSLKTPNGELTIRWADGSNIIGAMPNSMTDLESDSLTSETDQMSQIIEGEVNDDA